MLRTNNNQGSAYRGGGRANSNNIYGRKKVNSRSGMAESLVVEPGTFEYNAYNVYTNHQALGTSSSVGAHVPQFANMMDQQIPFNIVRQSDGFDNRSKS